MGESALCASFIALVCHACNMGFNIQDMITSSTIPYSSLFLWVTNFAKMYVIVVIVSEGLILLLHLFDLIKCTSDHCCRSGRPKCFDLTMLFVLFGALVFQAAFFIVSMTYVNQIQDLMDDELYDDVTLFYGMPDRLSITETMNDLQSHEKCCGVYDYDDYYNSSYAKLPNYGGRVVPFTCFRIPEEGINAAADEIDESKIYDEGCLEALIEVYNGYFRRIVNFIITSALDLADIVRVVFALCSATENSVTVTEEECSPQTYTVQEPSDDAFGEEMPEGRGASRTSTNELQLVPVRTARSGNHQSANTMQKRYVQNVFNNCTFNA